MHGEKQILLLCDTYREYRRISESRLGQVLGADSVFFRRLRNGGSCTLRMHRRVLQGFSNLWLPGLAWPKGIPRPKPIVEPLARKEATA